MSTLSVDTIQGKTTAGTVAMPAGALLQVVNTSFSTQTKVTATSYTAISGASLANNNFLSIIDSPSTTSSVTYKMFVDGNTLSSNGSLGAGITRLTLMEIAQ